MRSKWTLRAAAVVAVASTFLATAQPAQALAPAPVILAIPEVIGIGAAGTYSAAQVTALAGAGAAAMTAAGVLAVAGVVAAGAWCYFNCGDLVANLGATEAPASVAVSGYTGASTNACGWMGYTLLSSPGTTGWCGEPNPNLCAWGIGAWCESSLIEWAEFINPHQGFLGGAGGQGMHWFGFKAKVSGAMSTPWKVRCWTGTDVDTIQGTFDFQAVAGQFYPLGGFNSWFDLGCYGQWVMSIDVGGIHWRNQGHPEYWTNQGTASITVTCKTPGGTSSTVIAYANAAGNVTVPACPNGTYRKGIDVEKNDATVGTIDSAVNAESTFPDCFTAGAAACQVRIRLTGGQVLTDATDVATTTIQDSLSNQDYDCIYTNGGGAYVVVRSVCDPIKDAYTTTVPTASPSPSSSPSASPSPSGTATTSPTATASATPSPTNDQSQTPSPNPTAPGDCAPAGWELLNPFSLVRSLGCLLEYEFVPKGSPVADAATAVQAAWAASDIGVFVTAMVEIPLSLAPLGGSAGMDGCAGPAVPLPAPWSITMHPWSACDPPMSTVAGAVRAYVTVVMLYGGARLVYEPVRQAFNLPKIPSIRRNEDA